MQPSVNLTHFDRVVLFLRCDSGMETVEWAILAAIVLGGALVAIAAVGLRISGSFTNLNQAMQ